MLNNHNEAPEKVRIRNSYRKLILAEAKQLDKSFLETLHFIIDCYFAFKKGVLPMQQAIAQTPIFSPADINPTQHSVSTSAIQQEQENSGSDTFSLDFDL